MNNINPNQDYYNYVNNTYNQPNFNQSSAPTPVLNPYNGFIRGNMFPELYNSYKLESPFEIQPMNEQAEMLTYIDALGFAMLDLNLYLDVYPNDSKMISLFNQFRGQKEEYLRQYQNKYGPILQSSDAMNTNPWAWISSPWPWENK